MESERLFLQPGTKKGSGSNKYHQHVVSLVKGKEQAIAQYMKVDKLNPYGLRKGAATHAVSGTTAPPSIPSIARRGEWSIGSVLDVYWHFGSVGDHYLGRILAGFNPNDPNFNVLPPHWKLEDAFESASIRTSFHVMYGPIAEHYASRPSRENPTAILLRCMACVVYHSKSLRKVISENPNHDFAKIPLLHNDELLEELRGLVTIQPSGKFFGGQNILVVLKHSNIFSLFPCLTSRWYGGAYGSAATC